MKSGREHFHDGGAIIISVAKSRKPMLRAGFSNVLLFFIMIGIVMIIGVFRRNPVYALEHYGFLSFAVLWCLGCGFFYTFSVCRIELREKLFIVLPFRTITLNLSDVFDASFSRIGPSLTITILLRRVGRRYPYLMFLVANSYDRYRQFSVDVARLVEVLNERAKAARQ